MLLRSLLRLPGSKAIPALLALTGLLGMRWRIWKEKLLLVLFMKNAKGSLANLVLEKQLQMAWHGYYLSAKCMRGGFEKESRRISQSRNLDQSRIAVRRRISMMDIPRNMPDR